MRLKEKAHARQSSVPLFNHPLTIGNQTMKHHSKLTRSYKYRFRVVPRCERCKKILILEENTYCRLCSGYIAVYGKEVA